MSKLTTIRELWPQVQKLFGLQHLDNVIDCRVDMGVGRVTTVKVTMYADHAKSEQVSKVFEVVGSVDSVRPVES